MTDGRHGRPVLQLAQLLLAKGIIYYCSRSHSGKWTLTAAMATGLIITATSGPALPSVTSEHVCPCRASFQKNTSKAVCTNWNLWWLQVSPLQPPLFSGDLGQGWPRWLGLSDWKGRTTLLKECLVHCESRTTFVECNKMNEMNVSMNGMPRGLWDSAQDKVGREHGEANMGIRSRNA